MFEKNFGRGYQLPFNTSTLNFPHTGSIFLGESLKYVLDFLIFSLFNKSTENFPPLFKKFALLLVDRCKKHANSTDQQCFAPHMSKFSRKRICKIKGGVEKLQDFCFFGEEYSYLLLHFLLFLRVFGLFLRYSCSISFRELKNAIKISFFLYFGGLGTKIRFSSRIKKGRILVPAVGLGEKYCVGVKNIQG